MQQDIQLIGLNHRTAPLEVREAFALNDASPHQLDLWQGQSPIQEVIILSTCNRVEFLTVSNGQENPTEWILNSWAKICSHTTEDLRPYIYSLTGSAAIEHIFSVASSLDSMVLGEPQILGQMKASYRLCVEKGTTGPVLNRLMHKAFSVAKKIRTETKIAQNAVSISFAAVELAKNIFDKLSKQRVMLIGAGEMAELAASHLLNNGIQNLLVTNRTFSRATELACHFQGQAIPFQEILDYLPQVDIIISSTGASRTLINVKDMRKIVKKRKYKPMFFIDIAVPRDIDPDINQLDNVYVYDIDDLKGVVEDNLEQRREEAELAKKIIKEEVIIFEEWLQSLDLKPTILDLLDQADLLAQKELNKTLKKIGKDISPETRQAMEQLTFSLTKKLLHHPITFLKRKAHEEDSATYYMSIIRRIFDLDHETIPPDSHALKKQKKE
jgi:glutamyl-tRNA reductase